MGTAPDRARRKTPGSASSSSASASTLHNGNGASHSAGNQAAQRAHQSPLQPKPRTTPTAAPAGPLQATEALELYQGAEFPNYAGRLTYKREVTIVTPRNNRARLTVTGTANFPTGTALPLPMKGPPYPRTYHHVQPGEPGQLEMAAGTTYGWIVDVWYDDDYLKKWLTFPYHPAGGDRILRGTASIVELASRAPDFATLQFEPAEQYRSLAEFVDRSEDAARVEAERIESEYEPPEGELLPPREPAEGEGEVVRDKPMSDGGILGWLLSKIANFFGRILRGVKALWNALPWWVRGILTWAAKTVLVVGAVILVAYVIVEVLAAFGVVVAVATVAKIIGATMLGTLIVGSVIRLIREGVNPLAIPGVAIMEAIGVRDMVEALTDRSMTTGVPYNRSKEDRLEAFLTGGTQLFATLFGVSRLLKRKAAAPVNDPAPPPPPPQPRPSAPPPGQYRPRTAADTVSAADLDRPPAQITESRGAHPAPQGATHTDPFTGRSYRDSDVMARAKTQRSLRTGIDAASAERLAYNDGLRRNYIGLRAPGHSNAPGPDCLWARRNPATNQMEIVFGDATVNRTKSPYAAPPPSWVAEAGQAVQPGTLNLGNAALEAEIRAAFAAGRFVMETTLVEIQPGGVRFTPL